MYQEAVRWWVTLLLCVGLGCGGSCGAKDRAPKPRPVAEAQDAPVEKLDLGISDVVVPEPVAVELTPVKLIDPGAEPRRPLRHQPKPGEGSVKLTLDSSLSVKMGVHQLPPVQAPPIHLTMNTETILEEERIRFAFEGDVAKATPEPNTPAPLVDRLEPTLRALEKFAGEVLIDDRGHIIEAGFVVPEDESTATPQDTGPSEAENIHHALTQSIIPFPDEAVGPGARWSVTTSLTLGGRRIDQTTEYALMELTPEKIVLGSTVTQALAAEQPPAPPGEIRLDALSTRGGGQATLVPGRLLPIEAGASSHSELTQTVTNQGQSQTVDGTLTLSIRLASD